MKTFNVWIDVNKWERNVKIYLRKETRNGEDYIHSLGVDGLAMCERIIGCHVISKPYITMPEEEFNSIKEEILCSNKHHLDDEIKKLRGEVEAKNEHIKNLNEIIDKTLNKINNETKRLS